MTGILLSLLLLLMGAPEIENADEVTVVFAQDGPKGIYAVACDFEMFGYVEGSAQALCAGLEDQTILVYVDAIDSPELLRNVLAHESWHLANGPDEHAATTYQRFREHEAYAAGCRYQWVTQCFKWLGAR